MHRALCDAIIARSARFRIGLSLPRGNSVYVKSRSLFTLVKQFARRQRLNPLFTHTLPLGYDCTNCDAHFIIP
jgi:hypothetical protein